MPRSERGTLIRRHNANGVTFAMGDADLEEIQINFFLLDACASWGGPWVVDRGVKYGRDMPHLDCLPPDGRVGIS
jgi:hypothetical protein